MSAIVAAATPVATAVAAAAISIDASKLAAAARLIADADALLICTGAGMGVASGYGTFRGASAGVWPPLLKYQPAIPFQQMSCPDWFHKPMSVRRPLDGCNFAYSFWQFRYQAYSGAEPHEGYDILLDWIAAAKKKKKKDRSDAPASSSSAGDASSDASPSSSPHSCGFSFTSNIDGHWLRAGLSPEQCLEVHGSIGFAQCAGVQKPYDLDEGEPLGRAWPDAKSKCAKDIWPADPQEWKMKIHPETDCALPPFPACRHCGSLGRPNVLMFDDGEFIDGRYDEQAARYEKWRRALLQPADGSRPKVCIIEIGAGTAIPTVRHQSESTLRQFGPDRASLIRLNTEESFIPEAVGGGGRADLTNAKANGRLISFAEPSIEVLRQIDAEIKKANA